MTTTPPRRRGGRPRRGQEPKIDRALLERLLIHGELRDREDGRVEHKYPSFRDLAGRFGVSLTTIQRFASRHNCLERRRRATGSPPSEGDPKCTPDGAPEPDVEEPRALPEARRFVRAWLRAVSDGEIRIESAGEVEKVLRIAAEFDAEAQNRAIIPKGIRTLEELQDLHERSLREYDASTPGERGLIPIGIALPDEDPAFEPERDDETAENP